MLAFLLDGEQMNQKLYSTLLCLSTLICFSVLCFGDEIDPAWQKYENAFHGFSFLYPKNHQLIDRFETRFTKSGQVVYLDFFGGSFRAEVSVEESKKINPPWPPFFKGGERTLSQGYLPLYEERGVRGDFEVS